MTSVLAIKVPDKQSAKLLRFVADYGSVDGVSITVEENLDDVQCLNDQGELLLGLHTAARSLAVAGSRRAQLLGSSPTEQAKISEWISFHHTHLTPVMDDTISLLQNALETSTTIAGTIEVSLADLILYAVLHAAICAFPVAQHSHFNNVLRWYDYINHTVDTHHIFPPAVFQKPPFVVPPPPVPKKESTVPPGDGPKEIDAVSGKKKKKDTKSSTTEEIKKAKNPEASAPKKQEQKPDVGDEILPVDMLDLRVGKIVSIGPHPNADALYLEEIDVGEEKPRQVISGLVKFVPIDMMKDRKVVVVCNLKPAKMRDVMSYGMVLCASNDAHDTVDPIIPPEDAPIGERITFEGYTGSPETQINPKKKQLEKILPGLVTSPDGVCMFKTIPFMTSKGPVTATIPEAHIA